jgi:hypothetical protein
VVPSFDILCTFSLLSPAAIHSAPLWDTTENDFVGMISVTDFLHYVLHSYTINTTKDLHQNLTLLEKAKLKDCRSKIRFSCYCSFFSNFVFYMDTLCVTDYISVHTHTHTHTHTKHTHIKHTHTHTHTKHTHTYSHSLTHAHTVLFVCRVQK